MVRRIDRSERDNKRVTLRIQSNLDSMPIRLLKVLCRHFEETPHHIVNTSVCSLDAVRPSTWTQGLTTKLTGPSTMLSDAVFSHVGADLTVSIDYHHRRRASCVC